jgi:hypothetical protein
MPETTFRISIPKAEWNGNGTDIRSRLVTWDWFWKLPRGKSDLCLDFSHVQFMEPWSLALFTAYGLRLRHNGIQVRAELDLSNATNKYFSDMGLQEVLETGQSTQVSKQWVTSNQNTGLHVIKSFEDMLAFTRSTDQLTLAHCSEAADALNYVMKELSRNVLQHAQSPVGGVAMAQHFPNRRALQVTLCDLGIGILKSLEPRYPELRTDLEGIRMAVLPHASGAPISTGPYADPQENAGLGLFFCREIAWRTGGSFWLASGSALLGIRGDLDSVWNSNPQTPERVYRTIGPWPGTAVVVDFPTEGVDDFAEILKSCRTLAEEARRMSGPAGLDFLGAEADVEQTFTVRVVDFDENTVEARRIRDTEIRPRLERGESVILDFTGIRAPTSAFIHALLSDAFKVPGSLVRLSFTGCSASTREIVKTVAAYASYKQIV